jgi:hypothetical protein
MRWLALLLLLPAVASGCYRPFESRTLMMQRAVDARELYREPGFAVESMEADGVTSLAARVSFGRETFGQALGQGLVETLEAQLDAGVVHPNLASSQINEAGLAESYAEMLENYDKTNILDRDGLLEISEVVKVRYVAVPILVNFSETSSTRFSVFGFRLGKTASTSARFQLQIWDGHSGRIVWEGISDLTLAQETFREGPIRFNQIVNATWVSLIEQIPSDSKRGEGE